MIEVFIAFAVKQDRIRLRFVNLFGELFNHYSFSDWESCPAASISSTSRARLPAEPLPLSLKNDDLLMISVFFNLS